MRLGTRLANLVISDIRSMSRACDAAGGINLGQGICDLPTPPLVAKAATDAIHTNKVVYTAPEGILPLRTSIAKKIERLYGLSYDPVSEVVVTSGATGGFAAACLALFDPGDAQAACVGLSPCRLYRRRHPRAPLTLRHGL